MRWLLRALANLAAPMDLITGGTGLIGVHLLHACTAAGERIRALYRRGSDRGIVEKVFRHYGLDPGQLMRIEWVEGDMHDMESLKAAMAGIDRVYHAAAMVSFAPGARRELFRVNTQGTANVVNAALLMGIQRICHVSSTAAIGQAPAHVDRDESLSWSSDRHTSPYAASKYEAELEVYRGMAEGLDAVIVNPCVVIGPGIPGRSTMTLLEKLRKGTRFYPPGSNAVVDARDVAQCMRALMERGESGGRYLLVGENISYKDLFSQASEVMGTSPPRHRIPPWTLQIAWRLEWMRYLFGGAPLVTRHTVHSAIIHRRYSNAKVRALLGLEFRDARETLENMAHFFKGHA